MKTPQVIRHDVSADPTRVTGSPHRTAHSYAGQYQGGHKNPKPVVIHRLQRRPVQMTRWPTRSAALRAATLARPCPLVERSCRESDVRRRETPPMWVGTAVILSPRAMQEHLGRHRNLAGLEHA